jgi:ABC-type transporter Mla subunit MlaD
MEQKNTLFSLTEQMARIEGMLEENGGELTPELESEWQETRESLVRKVDNYNALVQKLSAYSEAIKGEISRLQSLAKTADNSLNRVKEHIRDTMVANGMTTLEGAFCKISLAKSTATETDDAEMLKPYEPMIDALRAKLPPYVTLDVGVSKKVVKDMAKGLPDGVSLNGVTFVTNTSIRIK